MQNVHQWRTARTTALTRATTGVALVVFFLSIAFAFYVRFLDERRYGLLTGSMAGPDKQVAIVRQFVPPGSVLLYFDPTDEAWQFGQWQRSLYPDIVVPHAATEEQVARARERYRLTRPIRFVIVPRSYSGSLKFRSLVPLPDYFGGIPISLGRLDDASTAQ